MYLVDFNIFNTFITKNGLNKDEPVIVNEPPFILEYKMNGILYAKIEMVSIDEFKFLKKFPNSYNSETSKNKYWIRGDEWKMVEGKQVQELSY